MDKVLKAIKEKIALMQKIDSTGFSDPKKAAEYFQDKEIILEEITKTLETVTSGYTTQIEALEATVKSLRDELKTQVKYPKELNHQEMLYNLGKGIAAACTGNQKTLNDLSFSPNFKSDNWTNPKDVSWGEKGWTVKKDVLGDPMGNMSTNDQFLINPVYENEIMMAAAKKSVMMKLVRNRPMMASSIFLATRERGGVKLNWITTKGEKIEGSRPFGAERVELKAYTLAGYIPWFDEYEEDVFVDLGALFIEEFIETYGQEFDRQCLLADDDPFIGAMSHSDVTEVSIAGDTIDKLTWKDFRDAVYMVPAEERKDCSWFLNETVLNHIANIEDSEGRPIWRRPTEAMPGKLDLYPYHEVNILPQIADIGKNEIFAAFLNPKRIIHGNRKGIEIKKFDGTTESMEYGELFLRFRKRDGFLVTRAKNNMVVLKTGAGIKKL
jgi:HK97 family phage major capsid protein